MHVPVVGFRHRLVHVPYLIRMMIEYGIPWPDFGCLAGVESIHYQQTFEAGLPGVPGALVVMLMDLVQQP